MLRHLTVRDFAQVKSLEVELDRGLTVITGESGAGKSILFDALGLVLGARADTATIRPGAERIDVSAEFDLSENPDAARFLDARELKDPEEPDRCLLRRTVGRNGRSRAYLNGTPVTLKDLETLAEGLIDIHGQNENQSLLKRRTQLNLLDDFAGAAQLAAEAAAIFRQWRQGVATLEALQRALTESSDRKELLVYQIGELDELGLGPDEYPALDAQHRRLSQAEALQQRVAWVLDALTADDTGGRDLIGKLAATILAIDDQHAALSSAQELLTTALDQLDDATAELRHYLDSLYSDPEELAELDARLATITELARKHRVAPEALAEHHAALIAELDSLGGDASRVDALADEVEDLEARYRRLAADLSKARREAAPRFAAEISEHMRSLGMPHGALEVAFTAEEGEAGLESVDYLIVTHPGFPATPLAKTASGGERSRISLAIQIVAAKQSRIPALVLDEADIGIGGTTADTVGRLLRDLADHTQVLCVTHAPQVAALGRQHLNVTKTVDHDTQIERLDRAHRVSELARMLGGQAVTKKTIEYAEELISGAGA